MTRVAILRKATRSGFSTWRFFASPTTGEFYAISNRSVRKWYSSMDALERAIYVWEGYGYQPFVHTEPVKRGAKQLIKEAAAV